MLMDPLVSALNGSQTLVSQGLRTLELCVDNLQPDFLYEHIQPVRAELMQALWRTLRNPSDQIAHVAFRVLGKFGGGNRKMMIEPQTLEYHASADDFGSTTGSLLLSGSAAAHGVGGGGDDIGPCITIFFPDYTKPIALPARKVIETAFNALKSSSTEPGFYRKQCWDVIRCYLLASLQMTDEKATMLKLLSHPSFKEGAIPPIAGPHYKSPDKLARRVHQMAVTGMFVAAAIKELRQSVLPTMVALVRHYTMVAIAQQAGPFAMSSKQSKLTGMDPLVLIDSLAVIMGHEEKELCKPGHLAMVLILDTATNILGSKERACRLPIMEYLADCMCNLCYERAWYAKLGGCIAIKFLFERMDLRWVYHHQFNFLKALLFIMMDLTGEVSSGAVDMARSNLEKMLTLCAKPVPVPKKEDGSDDDELTEEQEAELRELRELQSKSLHDVIHELVRQVTSPNNYVREQAISSLKLLAEIQGKTVTDVMEPHKEVLQDMIPPKKHLLRHQPVNSQIGLMDRNTFCTTLEPRRLFTIDLKVMEHKVFFTELLSLCEADDQSLQKLPCYKSVTNLVPLRKSALRALSACHYIPECREKIFLVLFHKALNNVDNELVEAGYECMKKFLSGFQIDMEVVQGLSTNMLRHLQDFRALNINIITRLCYLAELFPSVFSEKLSDQLLQLLKKWLEAALVGNRAATNPGTAAAAAAANLPGISASKAVGGGMPQLKVAAAIVKLIAKIPPSSDPPKVIVPLCKLILTTEKNLYIEPGSILRAPLMGYLSKFPSETIDWFLGLENARDAQYSRCLAHMVNHKEEGGVFRDSLKTKTDRLIFLMNVPPQQIMELIQQQLQQQQSAQQQPQTPQQQQQQVSQAKLQLLVDRSEIQYTAVTLVRTLVRHDPEWIGGQPALVDAVRKIWNTNPYHDRHRNGDRVDYTHWKEPKVIVKVLLEYFKLHKDREILLLFQLLRALCGRFVADFQFLRDYLETEVCAQYSVEWKRRAFFEFVRLWNLPAGDPKQLSQELKAKILQYVIIPCFSSSFDKGEGDALIGSPPAPDQDNPDNVVNTFINQIIDPEKPFDTSDTVRILLLQFSCLLVDLGAAHIHDASNKKQGNKLRRLMTYAWPCLLSKNCVDPATRYHGHLLLSHIIAKFAIHKRIVLQVFHSLLKAHAVEARGVVRQALEILTPSMPGRMEDGNTMLTHWTRKIIVEDGHTGSQLVHILQLVVKHFKVIKDRKLIT